MKTLTLVSAILLAGLLTGCGGTGTAEKTDADRLESKNLKNAKYSECIAAATRAETDKSECDKLKAN
jgi:hypothetical protein